MKEFDAVIRRVSQLRQMHTYREREKEIIRAICGGSEEGLKALLGDLAGVSPYSIPSANLVLSGLTRLGQKLGRVPDLRVDAPDDTKPAIRRAEKRAKIIAASDQLDRMHKLLGQNGMWLPGYAFTAWVVREKHTPWGEPYAGVTLLDPYSTYPAAAGIGEQPRDLAYVYQRSARDLAEMYPHYRTALLGRDMAGGGVLLDPSDYPSQTNSWMGGTSGQHQSGLEVVEYYDQDACWVVVPSKRIVLERYENPLSRPQFVVMERHSYDRPVGQYDHVIGLQATIAQLNSLAAIAIKDSVFLETNVTGELLSGQYRKGRHAVNYFTPGTQISKPQSQLPYQLFQQEDRYEKQFRTTAGYAVTDDGVSPAAQATGQGIDRLNAGIDLEIKQYLGIIDDGLELVDSLKLEWTEKCYGGRVLQLRGVFGGEAFNETYDPAAVIKGEHYTRRTFGAMAGIDDQNKISALLLLMQGGILDPQTILEEMDLGGRSVTTVQDRNKRHAADRIIMSMLEARAAEGDPAAAMAVIEIRDGADPDEVLKRLFTPQEPQMSPEEEAFLGQGQPQEADIMQLLGLGGGGPAGGMPPPGMPPEMAGMPV